MRLPKIIAALFAEPSPLRVPMIYRVSALRNCLLSLGLACLALTAWAAVGGRLSGSITDGSGALISQARVTVTNVETGVTQSSQTDNRGFYSFEDLPVGGYNLEVHKDGFKDYQKSGITVQVSSSVNGDVRLEVGNVGQSVTVSAASLQIDTTSTQIGEVITGSKMTTVPLNGRSFVDLLALQAGVAPSSSGLFSNGFNSAGTQSVNGGRESANGFMLNGGDIEDGMNNAAAIVPNLDSIAEFRILTGTFDAEYGNFSGAQVNVVTKSGTNKIHGDVFEFLRNGDLDARNFYSPTRGTYNQNQYGGTLGGPILRDKLFYFVDYQGEQQVIGQNTGLLPLPSTAERNGDLSSEASQLTGTVGGNYWANLLSQELSYPVAAGEAYYTPACNTTAACVFPGAKIPSSAINPISTNLLKYLPLPNLGQYYSTSSANLTMSSNQGAGRLDWSSNKLGMLSLYYYQQGQTESNPYQYSSVPGFGVATNGTSYMMNLGDVKDLGASKLNEFRLQYLRTTQIGAPLGGGTTTLAELGFPAGGIVPQGPEGVEPVGLNSYLWGAGLGTTSLFNNTYEILDNFSLVKGSHSLKFGGATHYDQITLEDRIENNGYFSFTGVETGSDLADFLIGAPANFHQGVQLPLNSRAWYFGAYGQDSWRVTPHLNLNYGLRWDVPQPWAEARGEVETYVQGLQSIVFPGAPTGFVFPGDPGIPKTVAPVRYNQLAPRFGIAYSPTASHGPLSKALGDVGETSIHAGFGLFYSSFENVPASGIIGDAPFGYFWISPTPPLFGTPYVDRATGHDEGQRFPAQVASPPSPNHPQTNIDWAQFLPLSGSPGFWYKNRIPYSTQYNLLIQRQLGPNSIAQAAYVGTQAHRLLAGMESNPGFPALCLSVSQIAQVAPGSPTCGPFGENGVYTTAGGSVINSTRGPFGPAFGSNQLYKTVANSNYNSLQLTWKYRKGPLEFLAAYTWSKSIDDASGFEDGVNFFNPALSRGLSAFNVPQNFVVSYHYELPFAQFLGANRLTNGWIVSGITRFASGFPVTFTETDDQSLFGTLYGPVDEPVYTPGSLERGKNPRSCVMNPSCTPYFNTSLFAPELLGQLGNTMRRFFSGPGTNNSDMALLKDTKIFGESMLELRFEFFNVFNHAQFLTPTGDINNSTFGYVTSVGQPRIGQVAAKIVF
jgi:Carboxypeptidase regulatory-like domain